MSQVITNAFASYWQACLTDEVPVVLDAFVLANIPGLDPNMAISPDDGLPPAAHIVYRQAVDQRGHINQDAVAYTIVMDTRVGDFEFNAMYLINTEANLVGMMVHKGLEAKLKTDEASGQTGNSLVKSMLMEYDRASLATVTTVDASTWQIDYAARLAGMDEDMRALALPLYGPAWFEGNGFEVFSNAGVFHVRPGEAVIGGLQAVLSDDQIVTPDALPMGVWVDVYRAGALLGAWENHVVLVLSNANLTDYTDGGGHQHHVAQLATLNADSSVTDTRRKRTHDHYWEEILDPPPAPTPEDIGAAPVDHTHLGTAITPIPLAKEDLNTLISPGVYRQDSDANASVEINYPEPKAGSLTVTAGAGTQHRYHVYNTSRIYTRAQYNENAFTPWALTYNTQNPPSLSSLGAVPPVGAVLLFEDAAINPATIYAGTVWSRVAGGRNIRGAGDAEPGGQIGGNDTVALGVEHMPYHAHTVTNHTHHIPGHAHYLFNDVWSEYGPVLAATPSGAVASGGVSRTHTDRDDYQLMASVGGNWTGTSSVAGETDTWGATPDTDARGSGAAFTITNLFYTLHIWKRLA